jgi:hypothetical protein
MATLECKEGVLRIYDGTRGSELAPDQVNVSSEVATVLTDITANQIFGAPSTVFALNTDRVYVGQIFQFNKVAVKLDSPASPDTGDLVVEYWDNAWIGVANLLDGTKRGANTMSRGGIVSWDVPFDWKKKGLYYVRMHTTKTPSIPPVTDLFEPCSGQFVHLPFVRMSADGPQGRARPVETPVHARYADDPHYIQEPQNKAPLRVKISCILTENFDSNEIMNAVQVAKVGNEKTWPLEGTSTKTLSQLPDGAGVLYNTDPLAHLFAKTVDVQVMWYDRNNSRSFWEWREVYFDPNFQRIEDETLALSGDCYGAIRYGGISVFGLDIAA